MVRVPVLASAFVVASCLAVQVGTLEDLTRKLTALGWMASDDISSLASAGEASDQAEPTQVLRRNSGFILAAELPDDFHGSALRRELQSEELVLAVGEFSEPDYSTDLWEEADADAPDGQGDPNTPWVGTARPFSPGGYSKPYRGVGPQRSSSPALNPSNGGGGSRPGVFDGGGVGPLLLLAAVGTGSDSGGSNGPTTTEQDTIADTSTELTPVPLPAGGWLLLTGLGALALRRRKS